MTQTAGRTVPPEGRMRDADDADLVRTARRYVGFLRLLYGSAAVGPLFVLAGLLLPVGTCAGLTLMAGFFLSAAGFLVAALYLQDVACPRCGLTSTFRRHGGGRPLGRCMNCGLSLGRIAAAARKADSRRAATAKPGAPR